MDLTFLLRRREILGSPIPATPGIRWLRLMNILPKDLLDEVFLGFTANSCFLVSYVVRQGDFRLRFWLVPPDRSEPREYLRTPFAELSLEKRPTYAFLADACGIRFIQSMKDSETFIVLFSSPSTEHVLLIWGTLPSPSCKTCRQVSALLGSRNSLKCANHFHLIKFSPDYHAYEKRAFNSAVSNLYSDDELPSNQEDNDRSLVPLCLNHFCPWRGHSSSGQTCICPDNATSGFHPSVCPETGRVRIAWVSQGQQIRVLSCSFDAESASRFPMGSYPDLRKNGRSGGLDAISQPPLAYQTPLLTSNYCSTCFFWPADTSQCRQQGHSSPPLRQMLPDKNNRCIFSSYPIRLVSDNESWPDGHRHQILPDRNFLRGHNCTAPWKPWDTWTPSLLAAREHFYSCQPISYLAMLQDIHASYMHWAITPINCEEKENDDNDENALSQSSCSSDANPEKLLANQLCGQCHSYFDAGEWRPLSPSVSETSRTFAHMEEVVFDLPENETISRGETERVLFTSPYEPDWILVYEIDHHSAPPSCTLCALLDVSTGRQRDPDEAQYAARLATITAHCPFHLRYSGVVSRRRFGLESLAARARGHRRAAFQHSITTSATTLMELNNHPVANARSLSHLCDPQGGFAFYL